MSCRRFSINLISATGLEDVRNTFRMKVYRMKVYAVVSIAGHEDTKKETPVDKENETNPVWNHTVNYAVAETAVQQPGVMLGIRLYCRRTFLEDKYIGEVQTTIKELFDEATTSNGGSATLVYKVRNGLEISQGELKLSCSFGEKEIIEPTSEWKRILIGGGKILLNIAVVAAVTAAGAPAI